MANFRTKIFGLAGVATMFSGMAFGQLCSTTGAGGTIASVAMLTVAGTNNIRSEGLTEQLPAITVSCPSVITGTGTATFNVLVQIGTTPITSAVTNTPNTGSTEIVLTGPVGTTPVFGTVNNNVVTFSNVQATLTGGTISFTVSYIRVNASVLPSSGAFPTPVTASAFISGITNTTSASAAGTTVAYAFSALTPQTSTYKTLTAGTPYTLSSSGVISTAAVSSGNYQVCLSQNASSSTPTQIGFYVAVAEGFAGAFKTQAHETGGSATAAASGTRIKLVFNNVPAGLNIYVPITASTLAGLVNLNGVTGSGGTSTLVATLTSSETGSFSVPTAAKSPSGFSGEGLVLLTVSGTTATAIYEITSDNLNAIDTLAIPVTLGAAANTITGYLTNPTLTVTTSLAPQTSSASQIPSFVSTASDIVTVNTVKFVPCVTNLLFPFVTNANGFETGIAISNTTKDPFGTTAQSGTCTLNYYTTGVSGATNPTAVTAPNLAEGANQPYLSGETYAFTLTQSLGVNASNPATFQGYIIAQCSFVDAHAFAYILGGLQPGMFVNPTNTAMGYLALVLTRGGTTPDPTSF